MNFSDNELEIVLTDIYYPYNKTNVQKITALANDIKEARARIRELENELKEVTSEARVKIKESSIDSWGF